MSSSITLNQEELERLNNGEKVERRIESKRYKIIPPCEIAGGHEWGKIQYDPAGKLVRGCQNCRETQVAEIDVEELFEE